MTRPALILLVDDEPDMGLIVKALARRCGWEIDHRPDASSAWDYLQTERPKLVLLDVQLPGIKGPELCRRLRAGPRWHDLPVALFTHGGVPGDVADGLEAGAQFLVSKDLVCNLDAWRERIGEILAAPRGRGPDRPLGWTPEPTRSAKPVASSASLPVCLHDSSLRSLAPEVRRALVRRAVRGAFGATADHDSVSAWLLEDDLRYSDEVPPPLDSRALALLADCLAEQLWCLLGGAASASVRAALTCFLPGVAEGLINR